MTMLISQDWIHLLSNVYELTLNAWPNQKQSTLAIL